LNGYDGMTAAPIFGFIGLLARFTARLSTARNGLAVTDTKLLPNPTPDGQKIRTAAGMQTFRVVAHPVTAHYNALPNFC